jgi:argininosuccinate synthase
MVSFDSASIDQCHAIGVSQYFGIQARMVKQMQDKKRK